MKYQMITKITFEAMDDIAAREQIDFFIKTDPIIRLQEVYEFPVEVKLQEIFDNKPPRGIATKLEGL